MQGEELVQGVLNAIEPVVKGIQIAAQNARYGFLVYNGSVHYWHISQALQREGRRCHLLASAQTVVDAVRKLSDKQGWLSCLLLQLALAQLEVGKSEDAVKTVDEAQQLSRNSTASVLSQVSITQAHLLQVSGKGAKAPKAKAPAKPAPAKPAPAAAGNTDGRAKDGSTGQNADASVQREEEACLLAAVQSVRTSAATDAVGVEDRLKEVLEQCDPGQGGSVQGAQVVAQVGWAAAVLGLTDLAGLCASRAAGSQDMGPRTWADVIRAQLQIAQDHVARATGAAPSSTLLLNALDKLESCLNAFLGCHDAEGVQSAARLVWNAGLLLLDQKRSKQLKRTFTSAAQALAAVGSPLHRLRATLHLEVARGDMADDLLVKAATEIKKAQALDYLAGQQEQQQWDLERPLDRHIEPLHQALTVKAAVEDPATEIERAVLLIERGRESKNPATRGQHLTKALQKLAALPAVHPPLPADAPGPERKAQHAAARLRTHQYCDIATLAWDVKLEALVREACALALAVEWSGEVDPEVVRWQAEVSLLEAKAASATCQKQNVSLLEPPSDTLSVPRHPATGTRKFSNSIPDLQLLIVKSTMLPTQNMPRIVCSMQALLRALKLGSACKQPWLVANSAVAIWNTYHPNLLQQRFAPLLDLLMSAVTTLLAQPDPGAVATQLTAIATAGAAAAEHAALLAVLAASPTNKYDSASLPAGSTAEAPQSTGFNLLDARKLAGPILASSNAVPAAAPPAAKAVKGTPKADVDQGLISAKAVGQLKQAAEACESVMTKLDSANNAAGGQRLLEAYARVQQLRGMPTAAPASISPALQQTSKVLTYVAAQQVIALIESLASSTAQDASKQEADIQQALTILATQQPVNLELHAKLAKAALQAGATAAAMQTATALMAAALPQRRAVQDILDLADAPKVAAGDWQWLSVASLVLGQAVVIANQGSLSSQRPATQIQLRRVCMSHLLAASRFANFAGQAELLESAIKAFWNTTVELMGSAEGRSIITDSLEELADLMCMQTCPDSSFQARWEDGLKHCEAAMSVLPSVTHLPLSLWKVLFLSMLNRSTDDEMARITKRGSQHAAAAWLRVANHAVLAQDQLHARQQAVQAVQKEDASTRAHHMAALGEWLVQQGTAKEAGKEILLGAIALLEFAPPATPKVEELLRSTMLASAATVDANDDAMLNASKGTEPYPTKAHSPGPDNAAPQQMKAADLDLLLRIYVLLASAANTRLEQCKFAAKAQGCAVGLLQASVANAEVKHASGATSTVASQDWLALDLSPQVWETLSASSDQLAVNKTTIMMPELTLRCVDQLMTILQQLGLHLLAVPLCHLMYLVAGVVLHSPALASASQFRLAALAEALVLPEAAAKAEKQAGAFQLSASDTSQHQQAVAMRDYLVEAQIEVASASGLSPRKGHRRGRGHGSRAALSSRGSERTCNRPTSSRGSTATGSSLTGADPSMHSPAGLQPYSEAEAWLQQAEFLTLHGQYVLPKELLIAALNHSEAFGQATASARAVLALAQLEQLVNQPQAAMQLVQQAHKARGDTATCCKAVQLYAELSGQLGKPPDAVTALQSGIDMMDRLASDQPALAVEANAAAATLLMQTGRLHMQQQTREGNLPVVPIQPEAALHCFREAAARVQAFGASWLHVEAAMAEAEVLLSHSNKTAAPHNALVILEAAETEAAQMHQEAFMLSPLPSPLNHVTSPPEDASPLTQTPAAPRGPSPQPRGSSPQPQALSPSPLATAVKPASLASARQLARVKLAKAEALMAAAQALLSTQEDGAKFAVPGRGAAVVKQFLAQAGILEPGAVPGHYEQEAIKAAASALELSPDPADQCRAQFALGKAHLVLYHLHLGPAAGCDAWPEPGGLQMDAAATAPTSSASSDGSQASEARQAAISSFQACSVSALQAGEVATALAAAEQLVACLGNADGQKAAEALLMAQSCRAVTDLEALYQSAAGPQAQEQLLLRLRKHLQEHLPAATLTTTWQQLQQKVQGETCMGARLALTPSIPSILQTMSSAAQIVCLHASQDASMLYCTALRGHQANAAPAAAKAKGGKSVDTPIEPVKPPVLARMPLLAGALENLLVKVKQYTTAKEHQLLAIPSVPAPNDKDGSDELAQQWQEVVASLEAFLAPLTALLTPGPAMADAKGVQQPNPVLLLLDPLLTDLPFEWLPQLQQATAVVRDFSLHVQYSRATVAAARQGIAIKQLSYIVDPCLEHMPQLTPSPTHVAPAPSTPGSKPAQRGAPNSTAVVDRASRSLVQAFQQDVLAVYGKEWSGITGNASYMPTDTQYDQLLSEATGFVYCGMCRLVEYVPPAVVLQVDMRSCELALLLDRAQTAKSLKRQALHRGELSKSLTSSAGVARMLSMQGVQSVAVTSLPAPLTSLPEQCSQLLQSLGQGKSLAEAVKPAGKDAVGGLVVYGLLSHKVVPK
ncbi:TPA: hypothetical protein ACH3X1_004837 [Trebouxia sp. C0004]